MNQQEVDYIITKMLDSHENVSGLNLTVGKPLQVDASGELRPVEMKPAFANLTPFQTETFALNLINQNRRLTNMLLTSGSCDFAYSLSDNSRFRVNIFRQSGNYSIIMRRLAENIPTIKELNLPETFYKISMEKNGIVFLTGATGSGKTTSLAAMLAYINEQKSIHVVTLEDPIEFQHPQKKSTFNQRELGVDFDTFGSGLRAALRQAPRVILVGEMHDRESVEIVLNAAETGSLVLTTLHTVDAGQTINRIIGMFNSEEEHLIRIRLADTIRWIVSQRLLPDLKGGRVAAFEILCTSLRVKDSILHGESEGKTFYEIMQAGKPLGMTTFDEYILQLYKDNLIDERTALSYSSQKFRISQGIDMLKSRRGETTTDIDGLALDHQYGK